MKKFIDLQQLTTKTFCHHVGSPETIRKTPVDSQNRESLTEFLDSYSFYTQPFDFTLVKSPQHISNYSTDFLAWFIGFSEGDGSWTISGKRLFFTLTQKDPAALHKIRTKLGFGLICNDTKNPEIKRFVVTRREHIKILISLFNGNLLLKKTNRRFADWVSHYNQVTGSLVEVKSRWDNVTPWNGKFDKHRERCDQNTLETLRKQSVVWNSAWLSGFLEAEGCFSAIVKRKTYYMRFLLDQTDELELFIHIRLILGDLGAISIRKITDELCHYRFEVSNLDILEQIIGYIKRYPLLTKKNVSFVRWKKLQNMLNVIKQEKLEGRYVWSEKRDKKISRLFLEIRQSRADSIVQENSRQVEERVHL